MSKNPSNTFRFLSIMLYIGAAIDLVVGLILLCYPPLMTTKPPNILPMLEMPHPEKLIYLYLNGAFLIIVGLFYLVAAIKPGRYLGNAALAICGRSLGAVVYFAYVAGGGEPVFRNLGIMNSILAALTLWAFMSAGGWANLPRAIWPPDISDRN